MSELPSQEKTDPTYEAFNKAVKTINMVAPIMGPGPYSVESNLRYALFQQATRGNADPKCDSVILEEVARWELWKSKADMTREEAMEEFIAVVAEFEAKRLCSTPLFA